jgi:CO/xanthine dehydrogenase FAD-binding subunit
MRLPKFEYQEPKTLKEAVRTVASDTRGSVFLAGGTDLLINMKHRVIQPKQLINLKTIPKLTYISNGKGGLRIGGTEFNFHKENLISPKLNTRSLKKRIDVKKMFC